MNKGNGIEEGYRGAAECFFSVGKILLLYFGGNGWFNDLLYLHLGAMPLSLCVLHFIILNVTETSCWKPTHFSAEKKSFPRLC